MPKLVVLFALFALALAKPSVLGYSAILAPVPVLPTSVSHNYRADVINKPLVATYAALPIVQKAIVAAPLALPAAVSHTYRSEIIGKPVLAAYAAPALHYAVHSPAVHAW